MRCRTSHEPNSMQIMDVFCLSSFALSSARVKLDLWLGASFRIPIFPPFQCFGTPIWPPWRQMKTLYMNLPRQHNLFLFSNYLALLPHEFLIYIDKLVPVHDLSLWQSITCITFNNRRLFRCCVRIIFRRDWCGLHLK